MKPLPAIAALFLFSLVGCLQAADFTWQDGTIWHDISFKNWDTETITLAHDGTLTRVKITTLPDEIRLAVYMAQAHAARSALDADEAFTTLKNQAVHFFGQWQQITTKYSATINGRPQWTNEDVTACVVGDVPADAVDGGRWDGWVWAAGRQRYTDTFGALRTIARYATSPELALTLQRADSTR